MHPTAEIKAAAPETLDLMDEQPAKLMRLMRQLTDVAVAAAARRGQAQAQQQGCGVGGGGGGHAKFA